MEGGKHYPLPFFPTLPYFIFLYTVFFCLAFNSTVRSGGDLYRVREGGKPYPLIFILSATLHSVPFLTFHSPSRSSLHPLSSLFTCTSFTSGPLDINTLRTPYTYISATLIFVYLPLIPPSFTSFAAPSPRACTTFCRAEVNSCSWKENHHPYPLILSRLARQEKKRCTKKNIFSVLLKW